MSSRAEKNALPNGRAIIEMAGIRKVYDTGKVKVEALKGVDLTIGKGNSSRSSAPRDRANRRS